MPRRTRAANAGATEPAIGNPAIRSASGTSADDAADLRGVRRQVADRRSASQIKTQISWPSVSHPHARTQPSQVWRLPLATWRGSAKDNGRPRSANSTSRAPRITIASRRWRGGPANLSALAFVFDCAVAPACRHWHARVVAAGGGSTRRSSRGGSGPRSVPSSSELSACMDGDPASAANLGVIHGAVRGVENISGTPTVRDCDTNTRGQG